MSFACRGDGCVDRCNFRCEDSDRSLTRAASTCSKYVTAPMQSNIMATLIKLLARWPQSALTRFDNAAHKNGIKSSLKIRKDSHHERRYRDRLQSRHRRVAA